MKEQQGSYEVVFICYTTNEFSLDDGKTWIEREGFDVADAEKEFGRPVCVVSQKK